MYSAKSTDLIPDDAMKEQVTIIFMSLSFIFTNIGIALGKNRIMPTIISDFYAKKHNCEQIFDFYDRLIGSVNPPFVWGYATGKRIYPEDSVVFWCRDKDTKKHKLIVEFNHIKPINRELLSCPRVIVKSGTARGLSIYFNEKTSLEDFYSGKTKGVTNNKMTHNGILSSYDGLELLYYCYKGKWLVRRRH